MRGTRAFAALAAVGVMGWAVSAQAQVIAADIGKNLEYVQTGPGNVIPIGPDNAFFFGRTFYANASDFDTGFMVAPDTTNYPYNSTAFDCCGHTGGQYQTPYISRAQMDSMFPDGSGDVYQLSAVNSATTAEEDVFIEKTGSYLDSLPLPEFDSATIAALTNRHTGPGPVVSFNNFSPDRGAFGQTFLSVFDLTQPKFFGGFVGPSDTTTSFDTSGVTLRHGHSYEMQLIFDEGQDVTNGGPQLTWRDDLRTDYFFSVAVPEPQGWAMLLLGVFGMGALLRRRRAAA